jgi:hypothetical protein
MITLPREHHEEWLHVIWPVDGDTSASALVRTQRHNNRIPDISDTMLSMSKGLIKKCTFELM